MATKTISIMDDVYGMLVENKLDHESFSDELRRILSKKRKKKLSDFFGILSEEEGKDIINILEKKRKVNIELKRKRLGL